MLTIEMYQISFFCLFQVCRHSIEFRLDNNNTYIKKDLGNSLIGQISGSELSGNDNKLSIVYKKYNAV